MAGQPCTTPGCTGTFLPDGFCDTCGAGASAPKSAPLVETTLASAGEAGEACPECGTARDADSSFCEACGHPFVAGKSRPSAPTQVPDPVVDPAADPAPDTVAAPVTPDGNIVTAPPWDATVATDARWYGSFCETWAENEQGPCPIPFPGEKQRSVPMTGPFLVVGRHADGIDLAEDPDDLAASHRHASLTHQPDGTWVLADLGSSNGTYVGDTRLGDGESRALASGASFHVGAFTRVTLNCELG